MGWFSIFPCFSKQRKLKKSVIPITSSSSVDQFQGNEKTCESVLIKVPTEESTNLGSIQNPLLESRDNNEDHLINDRDDKTVTIDADVEILPVETKVEKNTEEIGKLGVLAQIENREEREKEEEKGNGELGNLVQIDNEKERNKEERNSSGVELETENATEIKKEEDEVITEENKNGVQNRACSDSSVSSYISYPPMHRYHNCVINEDEDHVNIQQDSSESLFSLSVDPRKQSKSYPVEKFDEKEVNSPLKTSHSPDLITKSIWSHPNDSDHNLLNPVENLTQWKTLKKARPPLSASDHHQEKENINLEQEEETHEDGKGKVKVKNESAVTTSLSSWLIEGDKTPEVSQGDGQFSYSDGGNSWKSYEDRPILGAWTIDEVRQVSARSSPRKSPCKDLDETPIIGSVGSYWNHTGQATDSSNSPMSRKSRRREKKASSCHSTPVKARLERAFEKGAV